MSPLRKSLFEKYGRWAIVTGAASGIGREIAKQLAASKFSLVLLDVSGESLQQLASQLANEHDVEVRTIVEDLSKYTAVELLHATEELDVGLLVCCWFWQVRSLSGIRAGARSGNASSELRGGDDASTSLRAQICPARPRWHRAAQLGSQLSTGPRTSHTTPRLKPTYNRLAKRFTSSWHHTASMCWLRHRSNENWLR